MLMAAVAVLICQYSSVVEAQDSSALQRLQADVAREPQNARLHCRLGYRLWQASQLDAAHAQLVRGIALLDARPAPSGRLLGACLFNLGSVERVRDQLDAARDAFRRSNDVRPHASAQRHLRELELAAAECPLTPEIDARWRASGANRNLPNVILAWRDQVQLWQMRQTELSTPMRQCMARIEALARDLSASACESREPPASPNWDWSDPSGRFTFDGYDVWTRGRESTSCDVRSMFTGRALSGSTQSSDFEMVTVHGVSLLLLTQRYGESGRDEEGMIWEASQPVQVLFSAEGGVLLRVIGALSETSDGGDEELVADEDLADPEEWPNGHLIRLSGGGLAFSFGDEQRPLDLREGLLVGLH